MTDLSHCTYEVRFGGTAPSPLQVGDVLEITGRVTVHGIVADLAEVTALGAEQTYVPSHVTVDLFANHLEVTRAV